MIKIENDCVGCPQGCICCGLKENPHYYCDWCDMEFDADDLRYVGSEMVCEDCIFDQYPNISV